MFVSVVVALGTEPVLSPRSDCPPCVSMKGSWVMIAGSEWFVGSECTVGADELLVPHICENTPSATDCLVVVAGVTAGGSAPVSAAAEAYCVDGGARDCGAGDISDESLNGLV